MVSGKADGASGDRWGSDEGSTALARGAPAGEGGRGGGGPETNPAGGEVSWALIDDDQDSSVHRGRNGILRSWIRGLITGVEDDKTCRITKEQACEGR